MCTGTHNKRTFKCFTDSNSKGNDRYWDMWPHKLSIKKYATKN